MLSQTTTDPEWEFPEYLEFLFEPHRYKVLWGGRGGTKSWSAARALLIQGYQKPMRVLCTREVQKSIKDSVHQLLSDQVELLGLGGFYEVLQSEIRGKNGTKIIFSGLSNLTAESIKSFEGVDRVWCEESQSLSERSLSILTPTIRKDGSEIWFTLNPELDTDPVYQRYIEKPPEDCVTQDCSYHNNPWFPEVLEKERQLFLRQVEDGSRTKSDYENIWLGKTRPAVEGAIYPDECAAVMTSNRLCEVPYDPTLKVHTVWDLGWNDKMAIGFVQVAASSVRVIDYLEDSHRTYESYVKEIKAKDYNLANAWLPHDGKARNPQTGKSPIELLKSLGLSVDKDGVPDIGVKPGIEAARQMFPRVYFDRDRCTPLFNRLRRYARTISPTTNEPGAPKHDENAHGSDMFRYIAVVESKLTNEDWDMRPIQYGNQGVV